MRKRLFLLLVLLAVFSLNCMYSLHPFATDDCLDQTDDIVGHWQAIDGESDWMFKADDPGTTTLIYTEEGGPAQFSVRHYLLGQTRWIDLYPSKLNLPNGVQNGCFLPLHMLMRLEAKPDTLLIWAVDIEAVTGMITEDADVQFESVADRTVLTSNSEAIEGFLLRRGAEEAMFDDEPMVLARVKE